MEKLYTVSKNKTRSSDHELLIAKFRVKLKKVGKTTRPFRYELIKFCRVTHANNKIRSPMDLLGAMVMISLLYLLPLQRVNQL